MREFVLLSLAVDDLEAVSSFVSDRVLDHTFEVIEKLARREFEGPAVTLRTGHVVRTWPAPPLRIYYLREADDRLVVLRIYHGAREPIER